MDVVGVTGADAADRRAVTRRLADHLAQTGSVATVARRGPDDERFDRAPAPESDTAYRIGPDGAWTAAGADATLDGVLTTLSSDHDVAVVEEFPDARIPHVVLGGDDHDGEILVAADTPDDVDPEAVAVALAESEPYETLESLVAEVKRDADGDRAGAIATFTGRVRERDHEDDAPTTRLEFEKYGGVAEERMTALAGELEERDGVYAVRLHHRSGVVESGEDIVFVVVLAGHREEAFETVRDGINRLKAEVPIFKKEVTLEETFWVHERS